MDMFEPEQYGAATFPAPREFQAAAHEKLREGYRAGHKNQLVMAATGSGKTYLGLRVIHEALMRGKRAIFVCDRTTLINQTSEVADKYGLGAHGILQANHWRVNLDAPFQIASAQTLARRSWPKADVIVIDEAHTQLKVWTEHIQKTDASVVGLSATPFSKGLGLLFSNLVNAATMHELTELGILVPMVIHTCTPANMKGAETSGGEWTDRAAADRGMEIVGDVVMEWQRWGEWRKTIVFGATIDHCEELCRQFNEAGIPAAVFCADTKPEERIALLKEYRKPDGDLRILISVEALAKGFDVPDVGCVVDCRPLRKSLSTAVQMWGRGLRSSPQTGKQNCILLDHSGNFVRFLEDFTGIFYNGLDALDNGEKLDKVIRQDDEEKPVKACPSCGFKPMAKRCLSCGFEIQPAPLVQHQPGQMQQVTLGKWTAVDKLAIWEQAATYTKAHGNPSTAPQRAAHIYRDIVGAWPRGLPDHAQTRNVAISRDVLGKIRAKQIAFAKTRAA